MHYKVRHRRAARAQHSWCFIAQRCEHVSSFLFDMISKDLVVSETKLWKWMGQQLAPLVAVGVLFTLCRVLFAVFNFKLLSGASWSTWLWAFLFGVRFDVSILFLVNALWIVLSVLPFQWQKHRAWQRFLGLLFLVCNLPLLLLNLIDIELYAITGRRLNVDFFREGSEDLWRQIPQFAWNYFEVPLLILVFGVGLWKFILSRPKKALPPFRVAHHLLGLSLLIGAIALGIRGGTQVKPLNTAHALSIGHGPLSAMALNAPFSLLRTKSKKQLPRVDPDVLKLAHQRLQSELGPSAVFGQGRGSNVVVILLESFGAEYTSLSGNISYTPFLDSLMKDGVGLRYHFSNGRESIHALPAIFAGLPQLLDEPYVRSAYANNPLRGVGTELAQIGYESAFFHGGQNGTMHFDAFISLAGFQHYYGLNEYPRPEEYDGTWGVPDHLYLPWVAEKMSELSSPFLVGMFTLSSHQPYFIPKPFQNRFPKGTLTIHESIGYSDEALRLFFEKAKTQAWYANTLFLITADHTQKCEKARYCSELGRYQVPLVLYRPGAALPPIDESRTTQHTDVFWTILDWVGSKMDAGLPPLGRSIFRTGDPGTALWKDVMVRGSRAIRVNSEGAEVLGPFDAHTDWGLKKQLQESSENLAERYRATLDVYRDGLERATWLPKK